MTRRGTDPAPNRPSTYVDWPQTLYVCLAGHVTLETNPHFDCEACEGVKCGVWPLEVMPIGFDLEP